MTDKEPEITGVDGTVRKAHYGEGRQPWDDIKDLGWAPHFAAGNALKYVRRYKAKNGQDDLEKGRWYFAELSKMCTDMHSTASAAIVQLANNVTEEEWGLLRNA